MRAATIYFAFIAVLLLASATAYGQDTPAVAKAPSAPAKTADQKPNLMSQLGLTTDQLQQIRKLNVQRKPRMEAAQERLRAANRALDEAIYADEAIDVDVDARVKEVQVAQSELIALRSANELAMRRILTPEQLVRFRDLRAKFEEARQQMQERRRSMRPGQSQMNKHAAKPF